MAGDAKARDLLYVSDDLIGMYGFGKVEVFTYPGKKLEGSLTGLSSPSEPCTDSAGNVFVPDFSADDIVEYPHGSAIPIATLTGDPNAEPGACSVDLTTGNLAVCNNIGPGDGSVAIYRYARGTPKIYTDTNLNGIANCAYDPSGNLFVDGNTLSLGLGFDEMPKGSTAFVQIAMPRSIEGYGHIDWDGKYLTLSDYYRNAVCRLRIRKRHARIDGTTQLQGSSALTAATIPRIDQRDPKAQGVRYLAAGIDGYSLKVWKYPAGGDPVATLSNMLVSGVVVSNAPRR